MLQWRQRYVLAKKIATLTDRSYHIRGRFLTLHIDRFDLVVGIVEAGSDQIIHSAVHDHKTLLSVVFFIQDTGEKRSGIGDHIATRFTQYGDIQPFDSLRYRRCVCPRCNRCLVIIYHTDSTADIKKLDIDIQRFKCAY